MVGVGPWQGQPAYLSEFVLPETSHCCCVRELHSWMKPTGFRSRASAREGEVVMMGLGSGLGVVVYLICSYILCPWAVVVLKALDFARRLLLARR